MTKRQIQKQTSLRLLKTRDHPRDEQLLGMHTYQGTQKANRQLASAAVESNDMNHVVISAGAPLNTYNITTKITCIGYLLRSVSVQSEFSRTRRKIEFYGRAPLYFGARTTPQGHVIVTNYRLNRRLATVL